MPQVNPRRLQREGKQVLDIIARHFEQLRALPVVPPLKPGELARRFAAQAPPEPQKFSAMMQTVEKVLIPGMTLWQHPGFMAYYPANTTAPAVYADALVTAIGSVGLQWSACPAATELEVVVMDWLTQAMGIGGPFLHTSLCGGGVIQSTASDAMAAVAVCARVHAHRGLEGDERFYADSSKLVAYMSEDTNLSGIKAARVAGLRLRRLKPQKLDFSGNYGLTPEQVDAEMEADKAAGLTPCLLLLNFGTTNTAGMDDVRTARGDGALTFKALAARHDVWIHIDAAYAGASLLLPERHHWGAAIAETATSFNANGSKWMLFGFDSGFLWVRDRRLLVETFAEGGVYLNPATGDQDDAIYAPEFKDWGVPLGRKFRALRVWMVFSYFGLEGVRKHIRQAIQQADNLRKWVDESPHFKQAVTTDLGLVCASAVDPTTGENITRRFMEHFNARANGEYLMFASSKEGVDFVRVALGSVHTTDADVDALWALMQSCAAAAVAGEDPAADAAAAAAAAAAKLRKAAGGKALAGKAKAAKGGSKKEPANKKKPAAKEQKAASAPAGKAKAKPRPKPKTAPKKTATRTPSPPRHAAHP